MKLLMEMSKDISWTPTLSGFALKNLAVALPR